MRPDFNFAGEAWTLAQRGPRNVVDPSRPYALIVEPEYQSSGVVEDTAAVFITNRECPWRCLMCDLWRNTTTDRVPDGAVSRQIAWAMERIKGVQHVKLYNAGSFFDQQAIPRADWPAIAKHLGGKKTVIVESHPLLVGPSCLEFFSQISGRLEVAMGLETIDPDVLPRLNKRMSLDDFTRATRFLTDAGIAVRAFILLRAPYQSEQSGVDWARRSIAWAFEQGVECCVVIPTRGGNGAMERLQEQGDFSPPLLQSLCRVISDGLGFRKGRVLADLWEIDRFRRGDSHEGDCLDALNRMNITQRPVPYPEMAV